uniref:G-protein coupled receptors family 1 profile domain-containing protein n=1 Tax=Astyanax mexicanus TaxID=7994 RepID=A0A3B1KJL7_ASTMX
MNSSIYSNTQTTGRDSYATAVAKNVIVAALYVTINYINGTLVHTFFKHEIFTENPRYILFIHMVLNDMIQLTMARYIAVCKPLHHTQICTVRRTYIFIGLIWVFCAISILPDLFILLATEPLYYFLSTIICSRDLVFRIMFAAKATGADARKARNTILLHGLQLVLCMFTFIVPLFESLLLSLFPLLKNDIRFTIYVFVQILPRFISPVVYGLRDQMFQNIHYVFCIFYI